jgi:hypothetical protein
MYMLYPADNSDPEFLLDHCRCQSCFHPATKQRLKSLLEVYLFLLTADDRSILTYWRIPSKR